MKNVIYVIGTLELELPEYSIHKGDSIESSLRDLAQHSPPDLIAINGICEEQSGLIVVRRIRQMEQYKHTPIILFYTNWDSIDRIRAFEAGVNETLPISSNKTEIILRLQSLLRQQHWPSPQEKRELYGEFTLLPDQMKVETPHQQFKLTSKEFLLLRFLLQKRGELLPRERIFQKIWQDNGNQRRVVDTYIKRLRQKMGPLGEQIETIHGIGYRFHQA